MLGGPREVGPDRDPRLLVVRRQHPLRLLAAEPLCPSLHDPARVGMNDREVAHRIGIRIGERGALAARESA